MAKNLARKEEIPSGETTMAKKPARKEEIMAKKEEYEEKLAELVLPVLTENGFELYDTEYVKEGASWYLRAYIDKPGGITIDDCELVDRKSVV